MTVKYKSVQFEFDREGLARDMREARRETGLTAGEMDELVGKEVWYNTQSNEDYIPTVRTLLAICNMIDTDPRLYFVLEG